MVKVAWEVALLVWWVRSPDESQLMLDLMGLVSKADVILQSFVFVLCVTQLCNSAYVQKENLGQKVQEGLEDKGGQGFGTRMSE